MDTVYSIRLVSTKPGQLHLPANAALDSETGHFAWTPPLGSSKHSPYFITFRVSDPFGASESRRIKIAVHRRALAQTRNGPETAGDIGAKQEADFGPSWGHPGLEGHRPAPLPDRTLIPVPPASSLAGLDDLLSQPRVMERTFDLDEDLGIEGTFPNDPEIIVGSGARLSDQDLLERAAADALDAAANRAAAREFQQELLDEELRTSGRREWEEHLQANHQPGPNGDAPDLNTKEGAGQGSNSEEASAAVVEDSIQAISPLSESLALIDTQLGSVGAASFEAYTVAMEQAFETGEFSAEGIGRAARASTKQALQTIGRESIVRGLFEVGYGIKAFATDDPESGKKHMASAAQFMAVAALATGAAGAMGGSTSGGKKKKRDEVEPSGADASGSGKGRVIQHVTVIGNPTSGDSKRAAH